MSEKMNVIFILSDQHRGDHMSCAGNTVLKTPNLDKLASEGVRFTSAYVANPICMPNRASIFTGLYPNMHGARTAGMNLPMNVPTFPEALLKNDYHTIQIGKLHLQFMLQPLVKGARSYEFGAAWMSSDRGWENMKEQLPIPYYGFKEVELVIGHGDVCTGHYFDWLKEKAPYIIEEIRKKAKQRLYTKSMYETDIPEEYYPTSYITERSINFLERYNKGDYGDKSFFLNISYPDPHHPVCPPGKYKNMYNPEDVKLPLNFEDLKNLKAHPILGENLNNPFFRAMVLKIADEKEVKEFTASTYGAISMIDYGIGRILNTLEKLDLAENTMVIYTSDHGDNMGEHGLILKGPSPCNGVLNVPMIWKVPRIAKPAVSNSLISSLDISKTILNLLKINEKDHPSDMQGIDITPILKNPNMKLRDCCFIEHDEEIDNFNLQVRVRHLITEDYKLSVYENQKGYGDLYNRKDDPNELINLWYNEKYKDVRYEMVETLLFENLKAQSRYPKRLALS
ncbi:MAG: sulfatase [Candidatus Thorarchaeota archaeon]